MKKFPLLVNYMATSLITFKPDTPILHAINTFLKKGISGSPVVNDANELVGMLSEADCLKLLVDDMYNKEPGQAGVVSAYMSTQIQTIGADKTIFDAAYLFLHKGLKRLPVMDQGRLVGQVSRVDILRAIRDLDIRKELVPDSWKGRVPVEPDYKKSQYSQNS